MLDNILNLVKGPVMEAISNTQGIPENKKTLAMETTTQAFAEGLKQSATSENLAGLASLLNGGSFAGNNSLVQNIEGVISSALTQKVGLSQAVASTIATTVVPLAMKAISGKLSDPGEKGFNLESVLGALAATKGGDEGSQKGGLFSVLGHFFG